MKVIERILKNLLENDTYTIEKEETEILLQYIADLQRKEYNNSKAIEYINSNECCEEWEIDGNKVQDNILNILQGSDKE